MLGARVVTLGVAAILLALLGLSPVAASQDDWNCNLRVYLGEIGGAPADTGQYFGVRLDAADEYEQGDSKKPGEPQGDYVYAWFHHPDWGQGPIAADWRAPLPDATTKSWGIEPPLPFLPPTDYLGVKTSVNGDGPGCDDPCGYGTTYPAAVAVYVTWEFGVGEGVPAPLPPDDYTFTIKYKGGVNAKPAGCLPPGVTVPANNTIWDMRATSSIAIPLWSAVFEPFSADCMNYAPGDTGKFIIIVTNPEGEPEGAGGGGGAGMGGGGLPEMSASSSGGAAQAPLEGGGITESTTSPVLEGDSWHLISLPAVPADPTPEVVFRDANGLPIPIHGNLHRFDPYKKSYVPYYDWDSALPPEEQFGTCRTGEGYWLYLFEDTQISYEGYRNIGTQAIDLSCKGQSGSRWALIGHPFDQAAQVADCVFQSTQTLIKKDPQEAVAAGWIGLPMFRYEPALGRYVMVGVYGTDDEHDLLPWFGYWLDPDRESVDFLVFNPDRHIRQVCLVHPDDFYQARDDAECSNVVYAWTDTITPSAEHWPGGVMVAEHHYGVKNITYDMDSSYKYFDPALARPEIITERPEFTHAPAVLSNTCEGYIFIPEADAQTWWFGMWANGGDPLYQWSEVGMCQGVRITIGAPGNPLAVLVGGFDPPDVIPPGMPPGWDWITDSFPPWYKGPGEGVYFASLELTRGLYQVKTEYFDQYPDGWSEGNSFEWTRNANPAAQEWANDAWRPQYPYYTCTTPEDPSEDVGVYTSKWYDLGICYIPEAAQVWWTTPGRANGDLIVEYQFKADLEDPDPEEWQGCFPSDFLTQPLRYFRYRATLYDPNPNDVVLDEFELAWRPYPGVLLKDFVVHNPPTDPPIPEDTPYIVCNHAVTDPDDPEQPVIEYTIEDPSEYLYPGTRGPYTIIVTVGSAEEGGPGTYRIIDEYNPDPNVDHTTPGPKSHTWWDVWQGNPPSAPGIFWYDVEVWDREQCPNYDHRLSDYLEIVEHSVEFDHWDEATDTAHMRVLDTLTDSAPGGPIGASEVYIDLYDDEFRPVLLRQPAPTTTVAPPGVPNENPNVAEVSFPGDADDSRYVIVAVDGHAAADTYAEGDNSPARVRPAKERNDPGRPLAVNVATLDKANLFTRKIHPLTDEADVYVEGREKKAGYQPQTLIDRSAQEAVDALDKAALFIIKSHGPDPDFKGAVPEAYGNMLATRTKPKNTGELMCTHAEAYNILPATVKIRFPHYAVLTSPVPAADYCRLAVLSGCGLRNENDDFCDLSWQAWCRGVDCVVWLHMPGTHILEGNNSRWWIDVFTREAFKRGVTISQAADTANKEKRSWALQRVSKRRVRGDVVGHRAWELRDPTLGGRGSDEFGGEGWTCGVPPY